MVREVRGPRVWLRDRARGVHGVPGVVAAMVWGAGLPWAGRPPAWWRTGGVGAVTGSAFVMFGDAVRDALDPKLR